MDDGIKPGPAKTRGSFLYVLPSPDFEPPTASKKGNSESTMGSKTKINLMKSYASNKTETKRKFENQKKENAQDIISKSIKNKVNELKVSYMEKIPAPFWSKISSSADAAELLYEHWDKDTIGLHETFKVLLLNNGNKVKGMYQLSQGGITGTMVDIRILFAVILKTLSVAIILTHNHPSGTLKASGADREITAKIKKAAALFDIAVLDHILIVPNGDYYSFADNGIL